MRRRAASMTRDGTSGAVDNRSAAEFLAELIASLPMEMQLTDSVRLQASQRDPLAVRRVLGNSGNGGATFQRAFQADITHLLRMTDAMPSMAMAGKSPPPRESRPDTSSGTVALRTTPMTASSGNRMQQQRAEIHIDAECGTAPAIDVEAGPVGGDAMVRMMLRCAALAVAAIVTIFIVL